MKKTLLVLSSLFIGMMGVNAQITLSTYDVAIPPHVFYQATDTAAELDGAQGAAGANQIWDMSGLLQPYKDTLSFEAAGWAPDASFPSANVAVKQGWQAGYGYLENSASSLVIVGYGGIVNVLGNSTNVNQTITPAETLATFPYSYNSSFVNDYRTYAKFYYGQDPGFGIVVDSVREHSSVHKTVMVDAWGMLTTPLGTFNVIRTKETKISHDTIDGFFTLIVPPEAWHNGVYKTADSTTTYSWWANGIGYSLATATMDSTGHLTQIQWLTQMPALSIDKYSNATNELVYPNPAENEINFVADASKQKSIEIMDIAGRLIDIITITNNQTTVNTSAYPAGLYIYSISGKDNSVVTRGKFTITK